MTDRCAPPYEHANERWHWLKIHDNAVVRFWWPGDGWHQPLGNIGSNDMARAGYRYLRPCRPDDAEARERLEQENKRLREALDQTLATMQALHPSSAGDMSNGDYARLWNATMAALEALNAR
jgi:hypothetical protein